MIDSNGIAEHSRSRSRDKLVLLAALSAIIVACAAQSRYDTAAAKTTSAPRVQAEHPFAGKWTYRSYHNRSDVVVGDDANVALSLLFGEGVIAVEKADPGIFKGTFDMGGGFVLDMTGAVRSRPDGPTVFDISGKGRSGTPTDGWQYDYLGYLAAAWPSGTGQVPAIVGTVIRTKPHGNAKAGYVASFIATKQP